ncbi:hypothetical protein MMC19_001583 [Ptychographa xylographoides]|nr:hypothetical protein [Ptychographa xylographoides]
MVTLVDVHTHIYPPLYISLLSARTTTPYIHNADPAKPPRLIILPSDDDPSIPLASRGRPIDASYSSIEAKLAFMAQHSIATSVISLANPWLDFLPPTTACRVSRSINKEMDDLCAKYPRKLYFFAALPLSAPIGDILEEIRLLRAYPYLKGIILGTTGLGSGLDDPAMDPIWAALSAAPSLLTFIHPHYGLPSEVFGPRQHESGHILPLALGFPLETTIAFVRMFLAGVFDRFAGLRVLLAHAGGAVPFLAGRVESCVRHERVRAGRQGGQEREKRDIWDVMRTNVWLDGVIYNQVGMKAAAEVVGKDRVLWGTDHPFFPPVGEQVGGEKQWLSVKMNVDAVWGAFGEDRLGAEGVLGGNAIRLLGLDVGKNAS